MTKIVRAVSRAVVVLVAVGLGWLWIETQYLMPERTDDTHLALDTDWNFEVTKEDTTHWIVLGLHRVFGKSAVNVTLTDPAGETMLQQQIHVGETARWIKFTPATSGKFVLNLSRINAAEDTRSIWFTVGAWENDRTLLMSTFGLHGI